MFEDTIFRRNAEGIGECVGGGFGGVRGAGGSLSPRVMASLASGGGAAAAAADCVLLLLLLLLVPLLLLER